MAIGATEFYQLYRKCFLESMNNSEKADTTKEQLIELLLISRKEKREETIIDIVKKMRSNLAKDDGSLDDDPTLARFKIYSRSVKYGEAFWGMFSKKIPFESCEKVREL